MSSLHRAWIVAGPIAVLASWAGCADNTINAVPTPRDGGRGGDASAGGDGGDSDGGGACPPCVTNDDCNGGVCAQLGGDSYCAPACPNGDECGGGRACAPVTSVSGEQVSACVAGGEVCSVTGAPDAGPPADHCGSLVGPDVQAACSSCGARPCQTNGCYGGWWCNTATSRCQAPPASCGGGGSALDAGPPVTGTVTATGGAVSRLLFAVVGDTRPATLDDTAGYPTAIITKIFSTIDAMPSRPPFVVSTGDYVFASTRGTQASAQLDLYLGARARYSGVTFPALGNHECTGATASNCGPGTADGSTSNYLSFLSKMLGPIGQTLPYYAVTLRATDASWTAKLVFVAGNAWTDAQAAWLDQTMATATTYTFVLRHEPAGASTAPGVPPSETIIARYPYTLALVGHTHTYARSGGREVIIGNGGAPITGGKNYGFGLLNQRPDGAIQVDMVDVDTGLADPVFRFAVKADGSAAP